MEAQYIEIDEDGDKFYFKDRAMKILHRPDGPAVECSDGSKSWYKNGKLHRPDGPAVECSDGSKSWYKNGKLHREDGPAVEYADGTKTWYVNGELHRIDGPAVEYADGRKYWYIHGERLSEEEFNRRTAPEIVLTLDEIAAKLGADVSKLKIKK